VKNTLGNNYLKLFYPEGERIIRRSLDEWEEDLNRQFIFLLNEDKIDWNQQLLILVNQSSLVSSYLGQNELAYKICYGAISYFMNNQKSGKYIEGILQPWINIGRLAIFEKKFEEAHQKFNNINPNLEEYVIDTYRVNKLSLKKDILSILKNCFFYEKIKIYINDYENIEKLFNFCNENQEHFKEYYELFFESKIIALMILNDHLKASETIENSVHLIHDRFLPIFILRLIDIYIFLKSPIKKINPLILNLFNQHIDHIQKLNLQGLYFCLEICKRLKLLGINGCLMKMLAQLIQKFQGINEEIGLIESLILGKELSTEYEEKFNFLINKTKYIYLKKKFFNEEISTTFPLGEKLASFLNETG